MGARGPFIRPEPLPLDEPRNHYGNPDGIAWFILIGVLIGSLLILW